MPPEWILAGNGSDDILTIVTRALVGEGQLLRLPYPSYILYRTLAELQGARSEEIHFQPDWSLPEAFGRGSDDLRLVFLANPNSPSGTVVPPQAVLELAQRLPCPLLVDEAYADFAESELPGPRGEEREDHGLADAEQVLRPGRAAVRLPGGPAALDRAVRQGQGFLQLRCPVDRRGHGGHRRPGLAGQTREKILRSRGRLVTAMRDLGFIVPDSQANFVWALHGRRAVRPMYEELKRRADPRPIHGVSGLGRRPADHRRHGRGDRSVRGEIAGDNLVGRDSNLAGPPIKIGPIGPIKEDQEK